MTVNLFSFVGLYSRVLGTADHLLTKGVARAAELGVSEAEMLDWRLIGDMRPLAFQIMVVINFTQCWPARVVGLPEPEGVSAHLDVAEYKAAIAEARAWLGGLTEEQFAGRDDIPLKYLVGPEMEPTLPIGQWLSVFATTNIYFHLSTIYGILRANGADIGKPDLFASGL